MEGETLNTTPVSSHDQNKLMAILAYLGPLVIVSYLVAKDNHFVKFHIKQGLVLLIVEVVIKILWMTIWGIWMMWPLLQIINLALLVLVIIGIVNAVNGQEKPLPVVGAWASHFKF